MAEKSLTEPEWKKFSKGKDFKDTGFVKALAALDKAEKAKSPALVLTALDDIEKQADALRKAHKADKDLGGYLDGLDKALDKQRKVSGAEAEKAAAAEQEDDEPETPDLLTSKMVPLLRQVKQGNEMSVLLAIAGGDVAVLLSRRAVSPSRRKLLAEYLDAGVPKFFAGHCIFEESAHTFVLKTQAAGLAKKIKAALLKQTDQRLKVRVRGEDPNDIDDDGEPAEAGAAGTAPSNGAAAAAAPAAAAGKVSIVKLQQARLAWDAARKKVRDDIAMLQKDILTKARGEPDFADIALVIKDFETLKNQFDGRLVDKLDEALNADGTQRESLHGEAVALIDQYQAQVNRNPLLRDLDDNPFVKVTVQATLTRTLGYLVQQLKP